MLQKELETWASNQVDKRFELRRLEYISNGSLEITLASGGTETTVLASGVREIQHQSKNLSEPRELLTTSAHPLLLDYGPKASLFGRAPLPDPYRFFLEFHKLVRDQFAIEREPLRYLNYKGRMSEWLAVVYSRTYTVLSGPIELAEEATKLLDAQVAEYSLIPDPTPALDVSLFYLEDFWVVADKLELLRL